VRRRRELEVFSMSFLDAICCGFGAIILLFIVSRTSEPGRLEQTERDLEGLIAQYQQELNDIVGETELVRRNEATAATDLRTDKERIDDLQNELETIRLQVLATTEDTELTQETQQRLASARQSLTEEMRRLLADYRPPLEEYKVGGIPVDSEYIIFLIDTSGSMRQYAWDRVQQQLRETLEVYPTVKGIQVMNDEGEYMFKSYRDEWIPDTPTRRQAILDALRDWDAFSNSNPREGILAAIDKFYDPSKKISLYVYSDDFQQGSINPVVREIDRRNQADASGTRRVRIHAVAFPAVYQMVGELYTAANFATLMRVVCQRNGGTFIALPLITRESRRRDENN
jgi:von Willebrand factor type A domain